MPPSPNGNTPTLSRCQWCRGYFMPAQLAAHEATCADNPNNTEES